MPPRIVLVGGGSPAWGPLLLRDLLVSPILAGSTIVFYDRGSIPLASVFELAGRLVAAKSRPFSLERSPDLDRALDGADFVVASIAVGGLAAMERDLSICQAHGVFHSVGDTVGPGGLARALRTIPVLVSLAERMRRVCPEAWLLNLSNPMTTLCRAVTRATEIKTVGLCHEVPHGLSALRRLLGLRPEDALEAQIAGINHLPWLVGLTLNGRDAFPLLAELTGRILSQAGSVPGLDGADPSSLADHWRVKATLQQRFGLLPLAGDRHVAEFFPDFLSEAAGHGLAYGVRLTPMAERRSWRARDEAFLARLLESEAEREAFCSAPSGEAVAPIIEAVVAGAAYSGVVNLPNNGQIASLPAGSVVETMGTVGPNGAAGAAATALPPEIRAVTARHVANQEWTVEAALTGDRQPALQALAGDPLVNDSIDVNALLGQLLDAGREFLPQFYGHAGAA